MGATRGQMVRQLVTESLLLAVLACGAGVLMAVWDPGSWRSRRRPAWLNEVTVDVRVLLFASAASLAASLIFGLAPALHASNGDLNEVLKQGGQTATSEADARARAHRLRNGGRRGLASAPAGFAASPRSAVWISGSAPSDCCWRTRPCRSPSARPRGAMRSIEPAAARAAVPGVQSVAAVMGVPSVTRSTAATPSKAASLSKRWGFGHPGVSTVATRRISPRSASRCGRRDFPGGHGKRAARRRGQPGAGARRLPIGIRSATGSRAGSTAPASAIVGSSRTCAVDPRCRRSRSLNALQQHPLYATALTV